jgi:hypothetical protein
MAQCKNCQTQLSCGCQTRTASNGASCCAKCISDYETSLSNQKRIQNGSNSKS